VALCSLKNGKGTEAMASAFVKLRRDKSAFVKLRRDKSAVAKAMADKEG